VDAVVTVLPVASDAGLGPVNSVMRARTWDYSTNPRHPDGPRWRRNLVKCRARCCDALARAGERCEQCPCSDLLGDSDEWSCEELGLDSCSCYSATGVGVFLCLWLALLGGIAMVVVGSVAVHNGHGVGSIHPGGRAVALIVVGLMIPPAACVASVCWAGLLRALNDEE
jgi:hypothetical protein